MADLPDAPERHEVLATHETPVDWKRMTEFMSRALIALDGLWFMSVLEELGPERTLQMDIEIIGRHLKIAARLWRQFGGLDGQSLEDKAGVFQSHAYLFGHRYEISTDGGAVTMRLHRCGIYENLKRAGRDKDHDCRELCRRVAPGWFAEIEPRTGGAGRIDLQLPAGGDHCDWTVYQPGHVPEGGEGLVQIGGNPARPQPSQA
ncbi:MAG TPA: hypothetical protein VGG03_23395 [Thermoanaerobaculia bacterium]|jgi:hypothetical protein